ncbi:hypothetical protein OCU04_008256 [Sclerotinia nivalis]|uniref:Uncharacterized protein n=1 Tax=Sclerotinia nivalis TaxID=352851 RepID=A0A9X0AHR6_9HELO|nr:hypothetical protein OCU04_008256 [Sclerotinia nivalis]
MRHTQSNKSSDKRTINFRCFVLVKPPVPIVMVSPNGESPPQPPIPPPHGFLTRFPLAFYRIISGTHGYDSLIFSTSRSLQHFHTSTHYTIKPRKRMRYSHPEKETINYRDDPKIDELMSVVGS